DALEPLVLGGLGREAERYFAEPCLPRKERKRRRVERPVVRQVGREVGEGNEAERVRRLGDEQPAGPELLDGELEQAKDRGRVKVLEQVRAEDPPERVVV